MPSIGPVTSEMFKRESVTFNKCQIMPLTFKNVSSPDHLVYQINFRSPVSLRLHMKLALIVQAVLEVMDDGLVPFLLAHL